MGRSPKVITAALFVSVHLALLDFSLVVPSLTSIVQEWNVSYSWVIQVITLYVLMLVVSVPFVTALSRRVGRQFMLTASLAVFGIGAVISGISPNFFTLLVGRLLQGVGGGGMLALAAHLIERWEGVRRLGPVRIPLAAGAILALMVGGLIATTFHWRYIFVLQICPALLTLVFIACKPGKGPAGRRPLDAVGLLLFTAVVVSLMAGIASLRPESFWESVFNRDVFPFLVAAAGLLVPFLMVERLHDAPILPFDFFRRQRNVLGSLVSLFSGMSWGALLYIPSYAENALRLKGGAGGYLLAILVVVAVGAAAIANRPAEQYGQGETAAAGFILMAYGYLMLGTAVTEFWGFVLSLMMTGLGIGVTAKILSEEWNQPSDSRGKQNRTILSVVRYFRVFGITIGAALFSTFLLQATDKIPERVRESLGVTSPGEAGVSGGVFAELVTGSAQVIVPDADRLREYVPDHIADSTQELIVRQIMRVIRGTLTEGYQDLFVAAAIFSVVGFVCALVVVRMERDSYGK